MNPRRTRSLATLLAQVNKAWPNRSKASDGWIGDAAHAGRKSDHNPDQDGTVDAIDITHDPKNGPDIADLATALIASKDRRISYIIANGEIIAGHKGPSPWKRRKYSGANKHTKHLHISVLDEGQDDETLWNLGALVVAVGKVDPKQSILKKGSKGPFVAELQANLASLGYAVGEVDGSFGAKTEQAVKAFQKARGLEPDGWAGPRTIDAIGKALAEKAAKPKIEAAEKQARETPEKVEQKVKEKSNWLTWVTGLLGSGSIGLGWLGGMDWQAIVAGGAVLLVFVLILILLRSQIIAAVRDIKAEVKG